MELKPPGKIIKRGLFRLISGTNLPHLVSRHVYSRHLSIVMYHAVVDRPLEVDDFCFIDRALFEEHLAYLQQNFTILPLSEAGEKCLRGELKAPTTAITFDDGFRNNYDVAFPILRDLRVPAAIMLNTAFVDSDDTVWFCRLNKGLAETGKDFLEWRGQKISLRNRREKAAASSSLQEMLKAFPRDELMGEMEKILALLGIGPHDPIAEDSPYRMLNREAVKTMSDSGLIEFGAHSHSHAILSLLPEDEKKREIERSIGLVEELTGRDCKIFAYPNGRKQDFDDDVIDILRSRGIGLALTTTSGPNDRSTPAMEFRRYGIGNETNLDCFRIIVHHLRYFLSAR